MEQQQDVFKIKEFIQRRKWALILPFLTVILIAALICIILPNKYMSKATILIQSQQIPKSLVFSTVTSYADQRIKTITQEVMARSRILNLVKKYDLLANKRKDMTTEEIVAKIRNRIAIETISAEINRTNSSKPVQLTIAFTVSYEDEDPKKAQLVTNELASYYLEKNLEAREVYARRTTNFLKDQLSRIKEQIEKLENALAKYRRAHMEELPEFTNLNMQKLEKLNSDISNINMEIRSLEEQKSSLRDKLAALDPYAGSNQRVLSPSERLQQAEIELAELRSKYSSKHPLVLAKEREIRLLKKQVSGNSNIRQLVERRRLIKTRLSELRSRYSDSHPSIKKLKRELKELNNQIAKTKGIANPEDVKQPTNPAYLAIKSDYDKLSVSLNSLKAEKLRLERQIKKVYKRLHAMPEVAKKYNELMTDYEAAKNHYRELQQKLLIAQVSQGMEEDKLGETFQIVEPAYFPEKPYKPNRLAIMIVGIVLGLGSSIGLALILEVFDRTVHDEETIERVSGFQVLATIPRIVTPDEQKSIKRRRLLLAAAMACGLGSAVLIFHFFIMDLYIFWSKLVHIIHNKLV